ncbi:MAG: hypothetical protein AAF721_22645 [Myxococcota bacterium]
MTRRNYAHLVALLLAATACNTTRGDDVFASEGAAGESRGPDEATAGGDEGETPGTTSGGAGDAPAADDEGDTGVKFDTPGGNGEAGPSGGGCDKVDFLFVIDNSVSMTDEQAHLINSFPNFMATIEETVQAQDFHVLVTDMDGEDKWGDKYDKCWDKCLDPPPSGTCTMGTLGVIACDDLPAEGPTECDQTLGSGRTYDSVIPPQYCPFDAEDRYLTDADADLSGTFACAASMGAWGGGEFAISAMLAATSDDLNAPGGCNEGFLRDDAVLVVTVITDEEDFGDSPGDPPQWKQNLIAAKSGNETAVVVLGLVGDTGEAGAVCPADSVPGGVGAEPSPRLREFVSSFDGRGFLGSVCEPDYGPFFEQAVAVIDNACNDYEPEG